MPKILLILKREYWTRVRKTSFIIMTILGPILMGLIMIVPFWVAQNTSDSKTILIFDESGLFSDNFKDNKQFKFKYATETYDNSKKDISENNFDGHLLIPNLNLEKPEGITYFSDKSLSIGAKSYIESEIAKVILERKYANEGLDFNLIKKLKTKVSIKTITTSDEGEEETSTTAKTMAGMLGAVLIYMFIFIYGAQIMRGVIEEKTSRIIEIIITTVKPFQLMMGKVLGIALVGLTQFVFWILSTLSITTILSVVFGLSRYNSLNLQETLTKAPRGDFDQIMITHDAMVAFNSLDFPLLIGSFLFFFLAGYLFYGALFAAIGAAVDSESDTQQFMIPITAPLMMAFLVVQGIMENPESSTGFWFSIIPFTSPVVMMIRLPFIGMGWELILSMALLILGFIGTIWIAGRIYRVGILMHGKKISYKEIGKWLFYS